MRALVTIAAVLTACAPSEPLPAGVLVVVQEQQPAWIRNFNPLITTGGVRWPAREGVYEPMAIRNPVDGRFEPWLATEWAWDDDRTLRFAIREGVSWSDGEPMGPHDVVFTFETLKQHAALDLSGMWERLEAVEAPGDGTVLFRFRRPYSEGLGHVAAQPIVPRHVFEAVDDPVTFANPDPVGTGPFTEVWLFRNQVFELGRNPHYWQSGKPAVEALRFPAIASNEQANLALLNGEIDWSGSFVPAIDRIYVGRDPEHHHYWYPLVGGTVFVYAQTTRPPLDDARVRKALSMAIDRARVVKIAMYDYTRPAGITALSDGYARWRDEALAAQPGWTAHDPAAAGRLLDEAGYPLGADGRRRGPDGEPLRLELNTVTGWSDWVRAVQLIARDLEDVGVGKGEFDLSIGWSQEGPTPYAMFQGLMSARAVVPVGESAARDWHRYGSAEADELLDRFEITTDPDEQRRLAFRLQALFAEEAPAIPLFYNPSWGQANTTRFTGFPSAEDPYAPLSPNNPGTPLLVMTRVAPR